MMEYKKDILYYFNWHIPAYISGVVASDMEQQIEKGAEVVLLSCKGALKPCWNNMEAKESVCRLCRFNDRSNVVFNQTKVKKLYVDDLVTQEELEHAFLTSRLMDYHDIESIKELQYEGMDFGYGALSSYISYTRNSNPLIDDAFRAYFDRLLKVEIMLVLALKKVLGTNNIDEVVVFNGRLHDVRPVWSGAKNLVKKVRVLEAVRVSQDKTLACEFPGVLPQNIQYRTFLINKTWEESTLSLEEKSTLARDFYNKRRENILTQDRVVYTANQQSGLLPESWDATKKNIVVFSSSEDEFVSLGKDWDELAVFGSQIEGIAFIVNALLSDTNTHVYVRVHPNLTGNTYGYHLDLYELEKCYTNLTVIAPDSPVSSYALIESMSMGITFGSSTGIEAAASNKPVILLAGCYYYFLESTYNPKTKEELTTLLKNEISPKASMGALKFGFYMAYPELNAWNNRYEVKQKKVLGLNFWAINHLKVSGSKLIYKVVYFLKQKQEKLFGVFSIKIIPLKENTFSNQLPLI